MQASLEFLRQAIYNRTLTSVSTLRELVGHWDRLSGEPREELPTCELKETYAGTWFSSLESRLNDVNEVCHIAKVCAEVVGTKTNSIIIEGLRGTKLIVPPRRRGLSMDQIEAAEAILGGCEHLTYVLIGWSQTLDLYRIPDFDREPFISYPEVPVLMRGRPIKYWRGKYWIPTALLPLEKGICRCYMFRRSAVWYDHEDKMTLDISQSVEGGPYFVNCGMKQGARLLNESQVVAIDCQEGSPSTAAVC